jgi:hypothetical protein
MKAHRDQARGLVPFPMGDRLRTSSDVVHHHLSVEGVAVLECRGWRYVHKVQYKIIRYTSIRITNKVPKSILCNLGEEIQVA